MASSARLQWPVIAAVIIFVVGRGAFMIGEDKPSGLEIAIYCAIIGCVLGWMIWQWYRSGSVLGL